MNGKIFSDDPNAVPLLEAKLAKLTAYRARCVAINKCVRKKDDAGLLALGVRPDLVPELYKPDFAGRIGIPDYELANTGSEIRRIKLRLEELRIAAEACAADARYMPDGRIAFSGMTGPLAESYCNKEDA